MIRFGLRLTLAGGREAALRLTLIAVAVALGVAMLLTAVGGMSGVVKQSDRFDWANADMTPVADGPLWWDLHIDMYAQSTLARIDTAAAGPGAPVPPGLPRLPGPGEFYASPALRDLLASTPDAQLKDRLAGRLAGTIGDAALPAPDSLIAVVGHTPEELAQRDGAVRVASFPDIGPRDCPSGCYAGIPANGLLLILSVVALALIFPLLILVGSATRLAAARREQRFAAMRLVGATPRQVAIVSAVEATVSSLAGTAAGFVIFYLVRDRLAAIPFSGSPMFPSDLSPGWWGVLGVAVGVPVASALAARFALRRVHISPLGVTRRGTPRPPRAYRLIPLVLGLAELAFFIGRRPETSNGQVLAFVPGILIVMIGLVIAGPWLTMAAARLLASRARRPAALIAARRLADNPAAGFRAVSGLVLALFVTSVAVGVMGTVAADADRPDDSPGSTELMALLFRDREHAPTGTVIPAGLPGTAAVVRTAPEGVKAEGPGGFTLESLASCAELARVPGLTPCKPGAKTAWVMTDARAMQDPWPAEWRTAWPTADYTPEQLTALPATSLIVGTDGTTASVERARTVLGNAYPLRWGPITDADWQADTTRVLDGWKRLANVVVLASLVLAGLSLAVNVAGGLAERRRPFSVLRLTGVPLSMLRRVVALESATPLLTAALVAVGAGLLCAHLFLTAQMHLPLRSPGVTFYVTVILGVLLSLAVIASTLPLLRRITGPEAARND
ncbi:ABC transporter permease [Winogradskya consettensis]|uniref:ABC3 transporter permease C-terminal domain-containing protein n=1 Tax=Winogradskya consettensis TaxID=113560 RepID=A0A919SPG0_9ACTN|nr:FtsX-like permease family protein [Actinoplanes consettensis]GIM75905.1 hypothetical protein Aco04nite_47680 [Actinoplanes consettensis]